MSQIGYAEPKRMVLGVGDLYLDQVFVGQLKGAVTFTYTPSYAFQKAGNSMADQKAVRISEDAMISASICDLKPAQLRKAMGLNQALASGSTDGRLRKQETLKLSGSANTTLAETAIAGTMKVSKMDRSTLYISGTDYSATATTFARKGSAIANPEYVVVEYDFADVGAAIVQFGGEKTQPNTFRLDFVVELSNGKRFQITFFKAVVTTDLSVAFNDFASGDFTQMNFRAKALVDQTKVEGKNIGQLVFEDDIAAS